MGWDYKHTVLALCTLAFFGTMVARLVISPVVPIITDDFGIDNTLVGLALTGMWLAYATTQFPSGILGDRFGERTVILVSIGGTLLTSVLLALSPVFPVFALSVVVLGGVAGLHYSVAATLLDRYYDNIGFAMGVHSVGASVAGLVAPVAAVWIAANYGWRLAIAFGALVALPTFALFVWRVRPVTPRRPDQPLAGRIELEPISAIVRRPEIAFTTVVAGLAAFTWQGIASFLPAFLVAHRVQPETIAGLVFAGYFVVQSVARPSVGALGDRFGREPTAIACLASSVLGLALLVWLPGVGGLIGGTLALGVGLTVVVVIEPRFMDNLSERERGAGFGLVRSLYLLVASLGSVSVGFFADQFGWPVAIGVLMAIMGALAIALAANELFDLGV